MGKRNGLATPNSNFVNGKVSEETRTVHQASSTTLGPGKQLTTFLLTLNCGLSSGTGFCFILTLSAKAHEANDDLFLSSPKHLVYLFKLYHRSRGYHLCLNASGYCI